MATATREAEAPMESPQRSWAAEPPRSAKAIFHKHTTTGTFIRPITAPSVTRFDPVPGLPNLVQGVPASPRGKRLVPAAHRMPAIPVKGATANGPWAECRGATPNERMRRAAWPRQGTENSLMYRNPMERRAAHDGWGEEVSLCASPPPPALSLDSPSPGSERQR
ncbi:CCD1 [Symbiodinium necroappetens]|uniref:CCD1 protein n=1 Tax=Symbiodinium necroappetens TaxID=1628268 RepID=A0A812RF08_9DINO|nr:CCD1 [Symbiodinium necroappetens]